MTGLPPLAPQDFARFYEGLHERSPHKWLERAAAELCAGKIWKALSAPTGSGKTTLIECFLFALAYTAGGGRGRLPLRLFWVIDRRGVAEQVYAHAETVTQALNGQQNEVVRCIHERLVALASEPQPGGGEADDPVQLRLWRGGLTDGAFARAPLSPCAPAIVCTTVDQLGSRMLFRGYGVSRGSRPIEAALAATDSLIVLDEAHLSGPFLQTAETIGRIQQGATGERPSAPFHVMPISATLEGQVADRFELTAEERAEPALAQRLNASKIVTLKTGKDQVRRCVAEARRLASEYAGVVAVIANTVAAARSVARSLSGDGRIVLLIGPARPLDRLGLLERIPGREQRAGLDEKVFVIATQTIEVGIDLDFDALVTTCAPLASLVQRFGRLDRAGNMEGAARGVIVEPPKVCPVYGEHTAKTWEWLQRVAVDGELDFGPAAIERLCVEAGRPDPADQPRAPILGPWHLDLLTQTSYVPRPDPDVAVFLHGERALDDADVQLCWRADLDPAEDAQRRIARVRARPPHPGELLSLSPGAATRWLHRLGGAAEVSDLESPAGSAPAQRAHRSDGPDDNDALIRATLRVRPQGPGGILDIEPLADWSEQPGEASPPSGGSSADGNGVKAQRLAARSLRPGDVIVLPSGCGGCDEFGWAPESRRPVRDLGNLASARLRILLSTSPAMPDELRAPEPLRHLLRDVHARLAGEELTEEEAYGELLPEVSSWLKRGGGFAAKESLAQRANELGNRIERPDLAGKRPARTHARRGRAIRVDADHDAEHAVDLLFAPPPPLTRATSGQLTPYKAHAERVAARTRLYARHLHLSDGLLATLTLAARNHDAGKLDPRFQAWLNNGAQPGGGLQLVRSGNDPGGRRSRQARDLAGWPLGKRHESISAALVDAVATSTWPSGVDRDLLIHLVAVHHGDGRPFRSAAIDAEPVTVGATIATDPANSAYTTVQISSDAEVPWCEHVERFVTLNERYGPWGLAGLEALLVLADRAVAAEEGE